MGMKNTIGEKTYGVLPDEGIQTQQRRDATVKTISP